MSGICGIIRLDGQPADRRDLDRQTRRLAHLGSDRMGSWCDGPAGLAHRLMRITIEDGSDAQPLREAEITLVADLRLDNREEIAAELAIDGPTLTTMPDSALLFAAYRAWGPCCVERLVGDFAFAVWNSRARTLILARDHMGQRHVFFHKGDGFFAFATEIKGLWALPDVPRQLSDENLVHGLVHSETPDVGATAYEGIRAVPAGTVMTVDADGVVTSHRYWEPHADPVHEGRDETYYVETYRKILGEAVACRLRRATAPAGLLMGGGFDSSAICALAGPAVTAQGRKFIAVSSVMPEDYRGTIRHARPWVEMCRRHMPHLEVRYVTREGIDVFTGMERSFLSTDYGHSPNRYVTDAIYAEIAASGARIAMDGFGGDYTVNPRGLDALVHLLRNGRFRRFIFEFRATRRHLHLSTARTFIRFVLLKVVPTSWIAARLRRRGGLPRFGPTIPLSQQMIAEGRRRPARFRWPRRPSMRTVMKSVLRRQQNLSVVAGSISAAAHGLELTQPFHDKRVIEFGLAIPEDLYFKNGRTRHLARTALADLYPPEYQDRPPGNDDICPDFLMMAKRAEPRVLAEIDRMEKAGQLSRYFDFARLRAMLTRRSPEQHASGNEADTQEAMRAFLLARYIEWFRGGNA